MVNENKTDLVIISEANVELNDPIKMDKRAGHFADYKVEDKKVDGNLKATWTLMIHSSITHIRMPESCHWSESKRQQKYIGSHNGNLHAVEE